MRINKLWIRNFRCYKHVDVTLNDSLLLITGSNDGGKTAILEALTLLCSARAKPEETDFRLSCVDGSRREEVLEVGAEFTSENETISVRKRFNLSSDGVQDAVCERQQQIPTDGKLAEAAQKKNWSAQEQKDLLTDCGLEPASNKEGREAQIRSLIEDAPKEPAWCEVTALPVLPEVQLDSVDDAQDPVAQIQSIVRAAVTAQSDKLREQKHYKKIEGQIAQIAQTSIHELSKIFCRYDHRTTISEIEPDLDVDMTKGLFIRDLYVSQHGAKTPLSKLGSAKRRKLQLALLEWRLDLVKKRAAKTPLLLLYDEPDTHFDYAAQRKLFSVLRELSQQEGVQVIVVTHALSLIDRVPLDSILHLNRSADDNGVIYTEMQALENWEGIAQVARELGVRNHVVLNACLLVVEGETEDTLIPKLFYLYKGYSLRSAGVEIIREGSRGKDYSWSLGKHALKNGRWAFLILDADARSKSGSKAITGEKIEEFDQENAKNRVKEGENLFFVGNVELEDLFHDTLLVKALRRLYGHIPGRPRCLSRNSLTRAVEEARSHSNGITKGLSGYFGKPGHGKLYFSKPKFADCVCQILEEYKRPPIPKELKEAFDRLEDYVES